VGGVVAFQPLVLLEVQRHVLDENNKRPKTYGKAEPHASGSGGVTNMPAPQRKPLFDYQINIALKITACQASDVDLADWEREFLNDFQSYKRPTQKQYKLLWAICDKCGVR
jgi:hypothetical protein